MAVIAVPRPLREKLGEDGTDALEERFERRLSEEVDKLRTDMADLRANLIHVDVPLLDRGNRGADRHSLRLLQEVKRSIALLKGVEQ